ncbi:MAG: hypothetical protein RIC53_15320, partial [Cyclobacteriaceae bacterium]
GLTAKNLTHLLSVSSLSLYLNPNYQLRRPTNHLENQKASQFPNCLQFITTFGYPQVYCG